MSHRLNPQSIEFVIKSIKSYKNISISSNVQNTWGKLI